MVSSVALTVRVVVPCGTAAVPVSATVSSGPSTALSTGVSVICPDPVVLPAGIVKVKSSTGWTLPVPTDTVTSVSESLALPSSVPVTVTGVGPAPSATLAGATESLTSLDSPSSSLTSTCTSPATAPS